MVDFRNKWKELEAKCKKMHQYCQPKDTKVSLDPRIVRLKGMMN